MKMTDKARDWYYNTKFPHTDKDGFVWIDPTGYDNTLSGGPSDDWGPGPCFVCNRNTNRVDINFMTFFCNSFDCNRRIVDDLHSLKWPADPDDGFPRWEGEGGAL